MVCIAIKEPDQLSVNIDPSLLQVIEESCHRFGESQDRVLEQMQLITAALQSSEIDKWLIPLGVGFVSAVAGAMAAYLFSRLQWRITQRQNALSAGATELLSLITQLEDLVVNFWLVDASSMAGPVLHGDQLKIKSLLMLTIRYSRGLKSVKMTESHKASADRLAVLVSDIYDLATGDDFESPHRKASNPTAVKLATQCAEARSSVHKLLHF
ncbi:MAG: hypothetical protein DRR42_19175 [Gammaproteobacteria bacterium]|nr:MAG: hypothetical protein DRR42_19175 [Gammaproteobacteria bacterium]